MLCVADEKNPDVRDIHVRRVGQYNACKPQRQPLGHFCQYFKSFRVRPGDISQDVVENNEIWRILSDPFLTQFRYI